MPPAQLNLFGGGGTPWPEGLAYRDDFLAPEEESALADRLSQLPFRAFEFQGFDGKRRICSFGWRYVFDGSGLRKAEPLPAWLLPYRDRAAEWADLPRDALEQVLLTEYGPGAGIGWHRDRGVFGEVVGLSLLTPVRLRFRRKSGAKWERATLAAAPRSAYLLRGEARGEWQHSIAAVDALRYSITFRTLRP